MYLEEFPYNIDIKDKKLIEETLSKKEGHTISINTAKKGTKAKVIAMAEKNAKESLNRKIYETNNNKKTKMWLLREGKNKIWSRIMKNHFKF